MADENELLNPILEAGIKSAERLQQDNKAANRAYQDGTLAELVKSLEAREEAEYGGSGSGEPGGNPAG